MMSLKKESGLRLAQVYAVMLIPRNLKAVSKTQTLKNLLSNLGVNCKSINFS